MLRLIVGSFAPCSLGASADRSTSRLVSRALALAGLAVGLAGCAAGQGSATHGTSSSAASKPTRAQWELIVSQSSCQANPQQAYVNCSIGVRNRGETAGLPKVYAMYRYSDSGESFDNSDNGATTKSDAIRPHSLGFVYFSHPYNAQQHDLLTVAVTLNDNAKSWPYVRVADPNDSNWPSG